MRLSGPRGGARRAPNLRPRSRRRCRVSAAAAPGRCLAVGPARGGSRGLPDKNVRSLSGLPLLVHSVLYAGMSPHIARTIVSTDSPDIAAVARAHGADVP